MRVSERNYKPWAMINVARSPHLAFAVCACMLAQTSSLLAVTANSTVPRGISLDLWWTDARIERFLDSGQEKPGRQTSMVQVYISEQGRLFSKFNRKARGRGNRLQNQAVSGQGRTVLNWHFEGRTIVGDQKFNGAGARRIVVSFNEDFSSCTVQVIHGKEGNRPIRYPGLTSHRPIELVSIEVTGTNCQVRKGNIFDAL